MLIFLSSRTSAMEGDLITLFQVCGIFMYITMHFQTHLKQAQLVHTHRVSLEKNREGVREIFFLYLLTWLVVASKRIHLRSSVTTTQHSM